MSVVAACAATIYSIQLVHWLVWNI